MILRCQIGGSNHISFCFPHSNQFNFTHHLIINFHFFFFFCRLHPMMIPDLAVLSEDERSEAIETSMERAQRKSADD